MAAKNNIRSISYTRKKELNMYRLCLDGEYFGPIFFLKIDAYIWAKAEGYPYPEDLIVEVNNGTKE